MGVSSGIKIALAADVQAGVVIHVDELGAGGAFAVVVVQRLPRHEQLQKLVAAGAQRPHLRDGVGVVVHRAEAGDAALHLALNEQVSRAMPHCGRAFCRWVLLMLFTITPTIRPLLRRGSPVRGSAL